jgi:photosystem II stability/assembly factor-like uncharacterized protein
MKKFIILALGLSMTAASCSWLGATGTKGVLKSEDGGNTFTAANVLEKKGDISGINVNALSFDPADPDRIYLGSSSGVHRTTNGGEVWSYILTGMRVGDVVVDPSKSDIVYASGITNDNGRIIKTTDGGSTWKDIYIEPTKNNAVLSLAISQANSKVLLAGLNNGEILRSVDEGGTWQLVRDFSNPVIDLEYTDNTTAYALTLNNGLYVSGNQGSSWAPIAAIGLLTSASESADPNQYSITPATTGNTYYDMAFDRKLKGVIFLGTQQGLMRSVDSGANWGIVALPVTNETLAVNAVAIDPSNPNTVYIAVASTILKTLNGGVTWETHKLPTQQRVRHILVNPDQSNNIYLGIGER